MIIKGLKLFLFLITVALLISCNKAEKESINSSQNTLNWAGSYRGVIPNYDNQGVYVELELTDTLTYIKSTKQSGTNDRLVTIDGTFTWSKDGNSIILESDSETKNSILKIEKNRVLWENITGTENVESELENYVMTKVPGILFEREWIVKKISNQYINVRPTINSMYAYINFSSEENKIYGFSGCNFFNAYYHLNGQEISFTPIKSTKMVGPNINIESELFRKLRETNQFEIIDDELFFKNEQGIHLITATAKAKKIVK